jgi:hypothetical protein
VNAEHSHLQHRAPLWVRPDAVFHIRIRCAPDNPLPLTEPRLAGALLNSVLFYEDRQIWFPHLWLLMPDHLHALLSFAPEKRMNRVVGDWKHYHTRTLGVRWQENFFDHRLRNEDELHEKADYILNNPVAKGLCARPQDWPWVIQGKARHV